MGDLSSITTLLKKFRRFAGYLSASSSVDVPSSSPSVPPAPNLEELQRMVVRIEAVLDDAEKREIRDESVRLWLKDLRSIAHEAEDVLDEHEYEILRANAESTLRPSSKQSYEEVCNEITTCPHLDVSFWSKIGGMVRKIQGRMEEISKQRDTLHLRERDGPRHPWNIEMRLPTSHLLDVQNPVGRGDDLKKVTAMLLSDECTRSDLFVIPIVGIGGVGKTTLAQLVYNHFEVCKLFPLRGWVFVSEEFDLVCLTRKICEVFTKAEHNLNELSALQEMIIDKIRGKRFLLVLDDVWSENSELWSRLLLPLKHGKQGSAVITTTRSLNVARIIAPVHTHHHLKCLSTVDCCEILKRSAFRGCRARENYDQLLEIGKQIAERCNGLPLAAKSLGRLLSHHYDVGSWKSVLENDVWDVDDKIIPALMVSYVHLPSHLKQCFQYASLLPKDSLFSKDELVRLWMAQGFLTERYGWEGLEDLGSRYFDELLNRSFFQNSPSGDPSLFTMHDLIHDLAQYISCGEHAIITGRTSRFPVQEARHLCFCFEARYLAFLFSDEESGPLSRLLDTAYSTPTYELLHDASKAVRTILAIPPTLGLLEFITAEMLSLRVLGLGGGGAGFRQLPESIGNLKHLRYLSLEQSRIRELPDSVGQLYHLQTLIVRGSELQRLPTSITNLTSLRCLQVGTGFTQMPRGISRLTGLRSLDVFNVGRVDEGCAGVEELGPLIFLRGSLAINNLDYVEDPKKAKQAHLARKRWIRDLELNWHCYGAGGPAASVSHDQHKKITEHLFPCHNLEHLKIRHYRGAMMPEWLTHGILGRLTVVEIICPELITFPPLGALPHLKRLEIRQGVTMEMLGSEFRGRGAVGFPALEELVFEDMSSWVAWLGVNTGDFPRLRRLVLEKCPQLKSMLPLYHLPALEELVLQHCQKLSSIELWMTVQVSERRGFVPTGRTIGWSAAGPSSLLPASSSTRTYPPLKVMGIQACPSALFPPADEARLPSTLQYLFIDYDCPLLVEWCQTEAGKRALSAVPDAKVWKDPNGSPFVSTADHGDYDLA